jgi:hypothetical protein
MRCSVGTIATRREMSIVGARICGMTDEPKPESEMYIGDVVPDGPETQALISIKRITADELTKEHIGKLLGCNDSSTGANYGAKIIEVRRDDEHRNRGMLVAVQHPAKPGLARAGRVDRIRLPFDQELELFEMMAW